MSLGLVEGGEPKALTKRGLSEETCRKFGYLVGKDHNGVPVQIAPYYTADGQIIAQKLRYANKDFTCTGDMKKAMLYGQQLWRDSGKQVVITEGEIDCMTISQLQNNKWPVVSLRNGAAGAHKCIQVNIEWLNQFEHIILAFDMDEPGKKAVEKCVPLLPPGKVKVWNIPLKDANEMLLANREKELMDALWGAKTYRPDGIVSAADTWDLVIKEEINESVPYPWECLNRMYDGLRLREIVTFCAGSGIGKSAICREIAAHLIERGETVGYIALEESVKKSVLGLMSIFVNRPLHKRDMRKLVNDLEMKAAWDKLGDKAYFYDHWGSTDSDNLIGKIRYMVHGCGCRWIVLDHLSIVVSGQAEGEERRLIDNTMTNLRGLVEELNIGMLLVSHLKRPEGKGHEDGAATSLAQLRGSASIGQLSDAVIGGERDQQDKATAHITTLRGLKNRHAGETGVAGYLAYNKETGRLVELTDCPFKDESGEDETDDRPGKASQ